MTILEQTTHQAPPAELEQERPGVPRCAPDEPISIYEVHLPSWMRVPEEQNRPLTSSEIAPKLAEHLKRMDFTHVQLHSTVESNPQELKFLIEYLHQQN